jgi:hypothetical protein
MNNIQIVLSGYTIAALLEPSMVLFAPVENIPVSPKGAEITKPMQ